LEEKKELSSREYVPSYVEEDEIDLYELWLVLKKRKKWVWGFTLSFVLIALIYVLIASPVYRTETTLMPLGGKNKGLGSLAALASLAGFSIPTSQSGITVEAVLKSRTLREEVIKRLHLLPLLFPDKWDPVKKKWKKEAPTLYDGQKILKDLMSVSTDRKTGVLTLSVEFKKYPKVAYEIAKETLEVAREILNEKAFTIARRYRIYVGERLKDAEKLLKKTEKIYKEFLSGKIKEVPLIGPEEDFETYGKVKGKLIAKQAKLRALEESKYSSREKIRELKGEIYELKKKLQNLKSKLNTSYVAAPEYLWNLKKLQARMEIAIGLYETLLKEYELAKAKEMQERISFQVIDPPYVPEKKHPYKPKKKLILAVAGVSGLFMGIFAAFFKEWLDNVRRRYEEEAKDEEST